VIQIRTDPGGPTDHEAMSTEETKEVEGGLHLDPEEMRELGYRAVDLVVERLSGLEGEPAWKGALRSELEPLWKGPPPEAGTPLGEVMERAVREILPVAARVDHPRFFAFVPSSPTWAAVMADLLSSGFNTFQGTWLGSSGPSAIELIVLDWFRDWLGMPKSASGIFTSGGSAANLDAIIVALESAGRPDRPSIFFSDQGHSALLRAGRIAGVPREGIHVVPSGPDFGIDMGALREAVSRARAQGRTPVLVGANGGATNTGAVDPLPEIASFAKDQGLWFHVDAAYGGFAVLTEQGREVLRGLGDADSVALDPHKWLFQTFECGCLMVRDPEKLEHAFSVNPEYMQDTKLGREQVNFGDRGLQLTRSFRALKVWMTVQTFGLTKVRAGVQHGIDLANSAQEYVRSSQSLEMLSPAALSVVCYRFRPRGSALTEEELESLNAAIQDHVIQSGFAMLSSTRLKGRYSLRLCILNHQSTWSDVLEVLQRVERIGAELLRS
jgi:aromatic-L-amino-acid/L-tryptophan decarboxylase